MLVKLRLRTILVVWIGEISINIGKTGQREVERIFTKLNLCKFLNNLKPNHHF